jgi:hypothetical protein
VWSSRWDECHGKPKYWEKTCFITSLSTTNPTGFDLGSNPGPRGGKPVPNRLSYGMALPHAWITHCLFQYYMFPPVSTSFSPHILQAIACSGERTVSIIRRHNFHFYFHLFSYSQVTFSFRIYSTPLKLHKNCNWIQKGSYCGVECSGSNGFM